MLPASMGRSLTLACLVALGALILAASDLVGAANALSLPELPAPRVDAAPVSAGALLVVGGVLMMGGVLVVMGARSVLPGGAPVPMGESRRVHTAPRLAPAHGVAAYRGPRDEEFGRGHEVGRRIPATSMDELFDHMMQTEVGEARIVRSMPNFMRLRLHACRGCSGAFGVDGCAFECGLLEAGFARVLGRDVLVHEVACRARGAAACEFEVWH